MPSRHTGRRLLGRLLLALLLLVALSWLAWRWLLAAQGISQLDWQGLQLSGAGLQVDSLLLVRDGPDGSRLQVSASALQLAWPQRLQQRLHLPELRSQALQLSWQAGQGASAAGSDPQALLDRLAWLPRQPCCLRCYSGKPRPLHRSWTKSTRNLFGLWSNPAGLP